MIILINKFDLFKYLTNLKSSGDLSEDADFGWFADFLLDFLSSCN